MTKLVVEYDSDGAVTGWRYEPDDDYTPAEGELIADGYDHRKLEQYQVVDGELVEDPDYDPRSEVEKRLDALESATGTGDKEPSRGISQRLDRLEDRIAALEELHA